MALHFSFLSISFRSPAPPMRRRLSRSLSCKITHRPPTSPMRIRWRATGNINHAASSLRPRDPRVGTASSVFVRTFNPLILDVPVSLGFVVVLNTTTKFIFRDHKRSNHFLLTTFFCGVPRAVADLHPCSLRLLCSAHARTRTRVHCPCVALALALCVSADR